MTRYTVNIDGNQKDLLQKLALLYAKGYGTLTIHVRDGKVIRNEVMLSSLVGPEDQEAPFAGLDIQPLND